jgi:hypothetical protein
MESTGLVIWIWQLVICISLCPSCRCGEIFGFVLIHKHELVGAKQYLGVLLPTRELMIGIAG